ncbi:DNA primase family protein [Pelobacter propionicus]|uniref:Phage/plasmid primase, P4 family n=1 Tax=Pelobacter propionicus (strain DSM 2379 / NBRC 103807 / OttBd1) TaxID=338966 RepID=A1ANR4_PELPD|nr:phage/plasmid primase, P4 family [Pelobacter propionicus]ABK98984.1 phage/plasmid primase, P4 family [Pelobacter propionicus DSM 2379]
MNNVPQPSEIYVFDGDLIVNDYVPLSEFSESLEDRPIFTKDATTGEMIPYSGQVPAGIQPPVALPVSNAGDQFTDLRLSERFAAMFRDQLRYWSESGKWLAFDGRRWTTDAPGGGFPFIRELLKNLYRKALYNSDFLVRTEELKALLKLEAHPRQATLLEACKQRPELSVASAELDRHPMLLTVLNGTIDLESGALLPHDPANFLTRLVFIEYDPTAECPKFLAFLDRIFASDKEIISYIQRFAGYCLTGLTGEQVLLFFYGLGANGKSVLANVFRALCGDYASTAGAELLMVRDRRSPTNDLAGLRGSRLVVVSEFDDGERLAEAQIKQLTGEDAISCRFLYGEFFSYVPQFKPLLIGNHRPKIRGTDHGIWRRFHLVSFNVVIPPEERDPHLQKKLLQELPGILAWAVRGCLDWQRQGLNPPESVKAAVTEYRQAEDVFGQWIAEYCHRDVGMTAPAAALLRSFAEFSGWRNVTTTKFGRMLTDAGFSKEKSHGTIRWRGLGLIASEADQHWMETNDNGRPF